MAGPAALSPLLARRQTAVMGIVNLTPDSFHSASRTAGREEAVSRGIQLVAEGADVLDLGAESTRPGARPVAAHDEMERLLPVLEELRRMVSVPLSVDTTKAEVVRAAHAAGADLVNDVSGGLFDAELPAVVAELGIPVVVGHLRGTPRTMAGLATYGSDAVVEIRDELAERVAAFEAAGVARSRILIDPGLGFAKGTAENVALLARLAVIVGIGLPVVIGASRKRFLGEILSRRSDAMDASVDGRLEASLAAAVLAAAGGASMVRVHDVAATVRALAIADAIVHGDDAVPDRGERP